MSRDWDSYTGPLSDDPAEHHDHHVEARHYPEPPDAYEIHAEAQALKDEKRRERAQAAAGWRTQTQAGRASA